MKPLELEAWSYGVLMLGTPVELAGKGIVSADLGDHRLRITGPGVDFQTKMAVTTEGSLLYTVEQSLLAVMPSGTDVAATITITRTLFEDGSESIVTQKANISVVDNIAPTVIAFQSPDDVLFPGDAVTVKGKNFLLKGEGHTVLVLEGTFQTKVPPETTTVQAVLPVTGKDRETIIFELTPDVLGIRPGLFNGSLTVANEASTGKLDGTGLDNIIRTLEPPRIDQIQPAIAARGQRIQVAGRGFLPTDPFFEATTLIRIEGEFAQAKSSASLVLQGPTALALFPDAFVGNHAMDYVLRVARTPSGELTGLGLFPGSFDGVVSPMIISGPETILGTGVPFKLEIAPQRQVVYVKFLPGFSAVAAEMGLEPLEGQIKQRILDVCHRDYTGINIEFRDTRPDDFIEYSIIEVGGQDPNHAGLFGLDNTTGKDVGNLRFNDVIGGANAETQEQGYYAFGGVFVRSFYQLSPSVPGVEPLPIASARFDDLFGPFMPSLGGTPFSDGELGGARQAQADQAVRALGNIVGNTVSHEIGHSLGLANVEGKFHNSGDNPGWIMDAGNFRPFTERAELDGDGPAQWSPNNRAYLERILPVE